MRPSAPPRASRWEILGAWLHVWTPPRDVAVPPPPSRRRLAAWSAVVVAAAAIALAVAVPPIDRAKDDRAGRERAADAAQDAARHAAAARLQRVSFGTSAGPGAEQQLDDARAAILADARARHAAGELGERPAAVSCERAAGRARADLLRFSCLAVTSRIRQAARGSIGYPFSLVLQPSRGRFAWCRTLPVPGEGAAGSRGVRVPQPVACRGAATPAP